MLVVGEVHAHADADELGRHVAVHQLPLLAIQEPRIRIEVLQQEMQRALDELLAGDVADERLLDERQRFVEGEAGVAARLRGRGECEAETDERGELFHEWRVSGAGITCAPLRHDG